MVRCMRELDPGFDRRFRVAGCSFSDVSDGVMAFEDLKQKGYSLADMTIGE
jgi:hypothetical protein